MIITCKSPGDFMPVYALRQIPVAGVDSTADVTIYGTMLFSNRTHGSGYSNYQIDVSGAVFGDQWTLTNANPEVCALNEGGLATRVANGTAKLVLARNGYSKNISLTFGSYTSVTQFFKGFTGTSVSSALSNSIRSRALAGGGLEYYSNFTSGNTTATRNPGCWLADIDLSGSAIATDLFNVWRTCNSGVLISPQVYLGVAHWSLGVENMGPGKRLKFAEANGTIHTRTVLSRVLMPDNRDLILCVLNSPLPAGVKPLAIAGNWIVGASPTRVLGMGFQVHQDKRVTFCQFDGFRAGGPSPEVDALGVVRSIGWVNDAYQLDDSAHWLYGLAGFTATGITGDSGGLIGVIVNGQPVLVSLFTSGTGGFLYYKGCEGVLNTAIQAGAAAAGITLTDTVTIAPSPL